MNTSRRSRMILVVILTAFVLVPSFQVPSAGAENVSSVTYEYAFGEPFIDMGTPERLYGITGLGLDLRGGVPTLPVSSLLLAVPPGHRLVDVTVRSADPRAIGQMEQYPLNPVEMTLNGERSFKHEYECRPWDVSGSYVLEGVEVVGLNLRPLCWDEGTGVLTFTEAYSITLTYDAATDDFIGDLDRVRDLVDNPQAVFDLSRPIVPSVLPAGDYDHLIITNQELSAPFLELAIWKGERNEMGSVHENVRSTVVTLEDILADERFWGSPYSHRGTGNDTQTIVRNFIIAAYRDWGVEYVLIGGDDDIIPTRMVKAPVYDSKFKELPADIYFSGLDGDWDTDNDGVYGEEGGIYTPDEADLLAEVFVGRATVSTVGQAWNFVNKTIGYEMGFSNQYGDDVLLIGEKLDDWTFGDSYKQEVWDLVLADEGLNHSSLYAQDGTFSASAVLAAMGSDYHIINHVGHGNFEYMAGLYNDDVQGLANDLPFIMYTQACEVAGFDEKEDQPGDCIAEELIQGEGGAVAFIGNSRYGWYVRGDTDGPSQKFDISFFSQVYDQDVTDLGRALSYSKEEWVTMVSTSDTVRWVYLELNLLGDPETRVHLPGRELHDLAVQEVSVERAILGEPCNITVGVQNRGQIAEVGNFVLQVEGEVIANRVVSLGPGERQTIYVDWTPSKYQVSNITAQITCAEDLRTENDRKVVRKMVDRRVESDETWTGNLTLPGGLLIDPLVTVNATGCTILLPSCDLLYTFSLRGAFSLSGSTLQGSPFVIDSEGGDLELVNSRLTGMSYERPCVFEKGRLSLLSAEVIGGAGWTLNGTDVNMLGVNLTGQSGEWRISNSEVSLVHLSGQYGDGMRLVNATGTVTSSTWTNGSSGLSLDRCEGMRLQDLALLGNGMDLGIFGSTASHFTHGVENVSLTYGPLMILEGLAGVTIEDFRGSLYLIGCQDVVVRNSLLGRAGSGIALVGCSNVEMLGNAMENCTAGILAIDSQGLVWGNDLLYNEAQVVQIRSGLTFGKGYPIGGNHWSDKEGEDVRCGADQDLPGADGIFDDAYDSSGAYDRYPKAGRCSFVHSELEASFVLDASPADRVKDVTFTSTTRSGIGIANWTWDLGDGAMAYGPSAVHTYTSLGTVMVELTVVDHFGRSDSAVREVQVVNLDPLCDFTCSPVRPLPGEVVQFQDLSTDLDGEVVSWLWDFGDGSSSVTPSPTHTFIDEGDFLVSLTVRDAEDAVTAVARWLAVGNDPPTADFSWSPASVTTVVDAQFTSQSLDPDGTIVSWTWDFGDGGSGSGPVVDHRYSALGTYTVVLLVTDDNGATASVSKEMSVINSRPVAAFTFPNDLVSFSEARFEDRSYDLDGSITGWSWSFGDGGTSSAPSPTHTFQRPGVYRVNLTVTDDRGWTDRSSSYVTVSNRPPLVNMTVPAGEHWSLDVLQFSASGADLDGTVEGFVWDMGDGTLLEGDRVSHAYFAPGTYTVTVTCRDDSGGESSNSSMIEVQNLVPRSDILITPGVHPLEVILCARAEDGDGVLTSYNWSFGDGTFGEGEIIRHQYLENGSYEVILTVVDDAGGMAEARAEARVFLSDLFLRGPELRYDEDDGWTFHGEIVNEGAVPINVTLFIEAGGLSFVRECNISEMSYASIDLALTDLEEGEVVVRIVAPDGWDSDLQDNVWTASAERPQEFPYWLAGAAVMAILVIGLALLFRKLW